MSNEATLALGQKNTLLKYHRIETSDCLNTDSCIPLTKSVQFIFLLGIRVNFHKQQCDVYQTCFLLRCCDTSPLCWYCAD